MASGNISVKVSIDARSGREFIRRAMRIVKLLGEAHKRIIDHRKPARRILRDLDAAVRHLRRHNLDVVEVKPKAARRSRHREFI